MTTLWAMNTITRTLDLGLTWSLSVSMLGRSGRSHLKGWIKLPCLLHHQTIITKKMTMKLRGSINTQADYKPLITNQVILAIKAKMSELNFITHLSKTYRDCGVCSGKSKRALLIYPMKEKKGKDTHSLPTPISKSVFLGWRDGRLMTNGHLNLGHVLKNKAFRLIIVKTN